MSYLTPFEKHQFVQKEPEDGASRLRPSLPWSTEVICRASKEPRQSRESPLKEWWKEQQELKRKERGKLNAQTI